MIYASLGDPDEAMDWLEKGYEERFNPGVLVAGLRSSPLRLAFPKPCEAHWPTRVSGRLSLFSRSSLEIGN